jgi:exonuclease III
MEWEPINERIIMARFMSKIQQVTIIQCYGPTNTAEKEDKEEFYYKLRSAIYCVTARDICILMRDMNAKVGNYNIGREQIMGKECIGNINENGELFADFCAQNDLVIGGTIYFHKTIHKTIWTSPDAQTKKKIDDITNA